MRFQTSILCVFAFCTLAAHPAFAQTTLKNSGSSAASAAESTIATEVSKNKGTKQRTAKRWKQTYTLKEFYQLGMLPANVNFSFSGEVTGFKKNADSTVTVSLFSSFSIQLADKTKADLPVKATVRLSQPEFDRLGLREKSRKTWTLDGNYAIVYKSPDCVVINAMDNSLTPEPDTESTKH